MVALMDLQYGTLLVRLPFVYRPEKVASFLQEVKSFHRFLLFIEYQIEPNPILHASLKYALQVHEAIPRFGRVGVVVPDAHGVARVVLNPDFLPEQYIIARNVVGFGPYLQVAVVDRDLQLPVGAGWERYLHDLNR